MVTFLKVILKKPSQGDLKFPRLGDTPYTKIGKVFRVYRIKPHAPPLVRVSSIPLSLTLRLYSPGGVSRVSLKPL